MDSGSEDDVDSEPEPETISHVEVKKADGLKCERCWNYSTRVGEDKEYPTVCERCSAVLRELGESPGG